MLSPWKYGDVLPEKCRLQAQLTQLRRWPRVPDTTSRGEEDPTLGVSIVMEAPQNGLVYKGKSQLQMDDD